MIKRTSGGWGSVNPETADNPEYRNYNSVYTLPCTFPIVMNFGRTMVRF